MPQTKLPLDPNQVLPTDGTSVTSVNLPVLRAVDGSKLSTTGATAGHATFSKATALNLAISVELNRKRGYNSVAGI